MSGVSVEEGRSLKSAGYASRYDQQPKGVHQAKADSESRDSVIPFFKED